MTPFSARVRPSATSSRAGALVLVPLALLLPLAACGGDDAEAGSDGSSASASSSPSGSPDPSGSPSESPSESASESAGASPEADPTADPVTGEFDDGRFTGAGYAFDVPDGWQESPAPPDQPLIGAVAADPDPDASRFGDNLNLVVNASAPYLAPDRLERQLVKESRKITDTLSIQERTEIAGEPAVHATGTAPATQDPSIPLVFEQYAVYSDDVLYILTFTHAQATPEAEKADDVEAVLGSWEWSEDGPA